MMKLRHIFQTLYRLALTGWLGALIFFAAVTIKPLRSPEIEMPVRPKLALILFPAYYRWGGMLLTVALGAGGVALFLKAQGRSLREKGSLLCTAAGLLCLVADQLWIYAPLEQMMQLAQSQEVTPAQFREYHVASMLINSVMGGCCFAGALLACWPAEEQNGTTMNSTA